MLTYHLHIFHQSCVINTHFHIFPPFTFGTSVTSLGLSVDGCNCTRCTPLMRPLYLFNCSQCSATFCGRLPRLVKIDLSDTRVSPEGLSLLLACHRNLVKIGHKETFHAFQLIQQQQCLNSEEKFALKHLSSSDVHLTPDRFEYVLENNPRVESVSLTSAGRYFYACRLKKKRKNNNNRGNINVAGTMYAHKLFQNSTKIICRSHK